MFNNLGDISKGLGGIGNPDQIMNYAKGINFPTSKQKLVEVFRKNNAPKEFVSVIENLPERDYNSPQDLISALTGKLSGK